MDDLMSPAERRRRHQAWIASWGFTPRDLQRIKHLAEEATDTYTPDALVDLDVPVRVIAVRPDEVKRMSGTLLGVHKGRALLAWQLVDREREAWARRVGR